MKKLVIKPSSVDLKAPDNVTVVYRPQSLPMGRRPPVVIANFDSVTEAQAASDRLGRPHNYATWWRDAEGKRVSKYVTMYTGTRRHYHVSVPWSGATSTKLLEGDIKKALEKEWPGVSVAVLPADLRTRASPLDVLRRIVEWRDGAIHGACLEALIDEARALVGAESAKS